MVKSLYLSGVRLSKLQTKKAGQHECCPAFFNGAKEIRTPDPHAASVVLYQLSYNPGMVVQILQNILACQGGMEK